MKTPNESNFHQPAEWEKHSACWLAWPSAAHLWEENLRPAQAEFTALCKAIGSSEKLNVLVPTKEARQDANKALTGLPVTFWDIPFGDIWLRDTAPLWLKAANGALATVRFGFNGWGGKYELPHDNEVSTKIASTTSLPQFAALAFLEGGSVEMDDKGNCLVTRQCLLNDNRNPHLNEAAVEKLLKDQLGATKVLWLGDGLLNDHTDGHIDTVARFCPNNTVVCMEALDLDDPNREVLDIMYKDLCAMTGVDGNKFNVVRIPSPGKLLNEDGDVMPASYVNFYISNDSVIVPIYGTKHDQAAVTAIGNLFPGRKSIGLSAKAILSGGGAFHCITQQVPV
jgi:agmatine deiminase